MPHQNPLQCPSTCCDHAVKELFDQFFSGEQFEFQFLPLCQSWYARLEVMPISLRRQMRRSFTVSEANICHSHDYHGVNDVDMAQSELYGRERYRYFVLKDRGPDPQWVAQLHVFAEGDTAALADFRISDLATSQIFRARAWDSNGDQVYRYSTFGEPLGLGNFIDVYPGMPLRGLWPWPRNGGNQS